MANSRSPRYFLAFPFSEEVRDQLIAVQPPAISDMRLVDRDELHLTLLFLGSLSPDQIEAVQAAIMELGGQSFPIDIKGIGTFPTIGPPGVLWVGVDGGRTLYDMHRAVAMALTERIGFQPEECPYAPHVTLAHWSSPPQREAVEPFLTAHRNFQISAIYLSNLTLYSSEFVENRPRYRPVAEFGLMRPSP